MNHLLAVVAVSFLVACGSLFGQTTQSIEKPSIAVIDFAVKGDVGIKDAGQVVAELLLTRLGQDRFQLMERSQLATLLKEMDLTIALVQENPEKVYGKIKGIKYLVLGSVNKLGTLTITARLVDVVSGKIVQTAEVSAEDARGLQNALGELAKVLQMTEREKKAYLNTAPPLPNRLPTDIHTPTSMPAVPRMPASKPVMPSKPMMPNKPTSMPAAPR